MMEEVEVQEKTCRINVDASPVKVASTVGYRRAERTKSCVTGSTVSFHSLSYFVDAPATDRRRCNCCRTISKQILHDV